MSRRHDDMMMMRGDRTPPIESDHYAVFDHEERLWRNMSPSRFERSGRATDFRGKRSITIDRREYDWQLGGHSRLRSRSPPYEEVRDREAVFVGRINRERSLSPPLGFGRGHELNEEDFYSRGRGFRDYDHLASNVREDKDVGASRLSGSSRSRMLAHRSIAAEDKLNGGTFGLSHPHDSGPSSSYRDSRGSFPSLPGTSSSGVRIEKDSLDYKGHLQLDKSSDIHSRGEMPIYYSRDESFSMVPTSQFSNLVSTSSGRSNVSGSYLDSRHLCADDFVRESPKLSESLKFDAYNQKPLPDSRRNLSSKDRLYQQQEPLSPNIQHSDHTYSSYRQREDDDYRNLSSEAYRSVSPQAHGEYRHVNMSLHPRLKHAERDRLARPREDYEHRDRPVHTQSDYNHTEMLLHTRVHHDTSHLWVDHYSKDSSRAGIIEPSTNYDLERSHRNFTRNSHQTDCSSQDPRYLDGPITVRVLGSSKEESEHLAYQNERLEVRRNMSRELEMDHPMFHLESEYNNERSARTAEMRRGQSGVQFASELDDEDDVQALRSQMWEAEDLRVKHRSSRVFKRDYGGEDDVSRYSSRNAMPHQQYMMDPGDSGDLWHNEERQELQFPETERSNHHQYGTPTRMFDGRINQTDISHGKSLADRGPSVQVRRNFDSFHKPNSRHTKGITAPGSLSLSRHYQYNKRSDIQRHSNVWKRINDEQHMEPFEDADTLENSGFTSYHETVEDTEEFKQLVTKAFWKFSKKLNDNPGVRRRYTEQGKAGALFCVVCSKSLSKEFKDTRRLATHAFMTHKTRRSAQHLGLLKAICVTMGWNSDLDHKAIKWTPEVLSQSEALAQKEDLMLWPPVLIIHNVNISSNNPNHHKVVKEEELEVILRGKGSMKGKIKVCLGNPANYSIMVVKFLGTFLGLQDVERLHKYFADNKHGRLDLEQLASKNSKRVEAELPEEGKVNEQALYGFIGIADDLDKLDFDTKRKCLLRSKRGLQDFADEPVKPGEG